MRRPIVFDGRNLCEAGAHAATGLRVLLDRPQARPSTVGRRCACSSPAARDSSARTSASSSSARAADVVCMDNLLTGSTDNIADICRDRGFTLRRARRDRLHPRRRAARLRASLRQPGLAPRLPGAAHPDPEGRRARHAQGARLAKAKGARFLLASTSEVYGDPLVHPQREDYWGNVNPVGPRGVYDEAKRFAEAITMAYHRSTGSTPASCASSTRTGRACGSTTGARSRPSSRQALRGEPLTVFGDGCADALVQLRRRSRRRPLAAHAGAGRTTRSTSATRTR